MLTTTAGLWLAVVLSGLYHGMNPGMGWPLAVSAGLMDGGTRPLGKAMGALAVGHLVAMLAILLPFAAMTLIYEWDRPIRIAAGAIVISMGLWILLTRRHPRFLARVPPGRLALWSFLVALAHGAALMLVPIYLGLCALEELDAGHQAAGNLMALNAGIALSVALVHTLAMVGSGGALAFGVYKWLGLSFLRKGWFDLEVFWGASLVLVGLVGLWSAW